MRRSACAPSHAQAEPNPRASANARLAARSGLNSRRRIHFKLLLDVGAARSNRVSLKGRCRGIGSGGRGDDLKRRRPPIPLIVRRRRAMMMVAALIMGAAIRPRPVGVKIFGHSTDATRGAKTFLPASETTE